MRGDRRVKDSDGRDRSFSIELRDQRTDNVELEAPQLDNRRLRIRVEATPGCTSLRSIKTDGWSEL